MGQCITKRICLRAFPKESDGIPSESYRIGPLSKLPSATSFIRKTLYEITYLKERRNYAIC